MPLLVTIFILKIGIDRFSFLNALAALTSAFVRNADFILGTEVEYKSVWAYSCWTFSTFDFVFSTYVVLFTRFACFVASVFAVLPLVSGTLISSFLKLPVEGGKSARYNGIC